MLFHAERDVSIALLDGTADSALELGAMLDATRRKLRSADETAIERGKAKGFVRRGELPNGKLCTTATLHQGLVFGATILTYTAADSEMVRSIVESLSIDAAARLDPLTIHGISLATTDGLVVNPMLSSPVTLVEAAPAARAGYASMFAIVATPLRSEDDLDGAIATFLADADEKTARFERFDLGGLPAMEVEADGTGTRSSERLYLLVISELPTRLLIGSGWWKSDRPEMRERYRKIARGMQGDPKIFGPVHLP